METFNASITVTDLLMKTLENASKDLAVRCIEECASKYGFESEEAIRMLGLQNLSLIRKAMAKRSPSKEKKEKKVEKRESKFPLPFVASEVDEHGCQGLAFNRGLFTQCTKKPMDSNAFCTSCQSEADKNALAQPDCGCVKDRLATGLYDFKDSKGRSPVSYVKVLEKLKLTVDQAMEEAGKKNIEIDEAHFVVAEKKKIVKEKVSVRGRPKKPVKEVEANEVVDMFAKLSLEGADADAEESVEESEEKETIVKTNKKNKISEDEKALKKAQMEAEREQKKVEREAKLAQEKADREEKRQLEIAEKKAQREAKLAQEKADRVAKLAQEKAEREAKRAEEKTKSSKKTTSKTSKKQEEPVAQKPEEPAQSSAKVKVTRIQIDGKMYLKSGANILYDEATKEEVGIYDIETKSIKPLPEEDDEEEEDEYESEDEEEN